MADEHIEETALTVVKLKDEYEPKPYGIYKMFWIFMIGCVAGVIIEVIYCFVLTGHYENRSGVIYGPFNPVYGFGAVVITLFLNNLKDKGNLNIFISSMILGGLFEYLCSWVQEVFVGTVSWDYAANQISIGGRTSLVYMVFWGILGLAWLRIVLPILSRGIDKIPEKIGQPIAYLLVIFMVFNCTISALAVRRQTDRLLGNPPANEVERFIDQTYTDEFLKKIYPNMKIPGQKPNIER